ncbi:MAG: sigma-70 family RNA polymerase sigma factor [Bacteroidota bacterium]|nr:sigma-70 family RNA polymerase sigma factor [Bacteroidota bacterium]
MQSLTNFTDQQLIELYMNGNNDAISILLDRHKDKIYTSIYLLIKDKYLAEDFFQDTFVKIIDTIQSGKYSEKGKFLPWAMRIAHNICIDHFRKIKRMPSIKTEDDRDIFETINFSESGVDDRIMQGESHSIVRKMINLLPEDQREVIVMRHYAELSFKEISDLMDCSINTSLGRMRYALSNLRKMMTEDQMHYRLV